MGDFFKDLVYSENDIITFPSGIPGFEKATTFVRDVHVDRLHPRYNSLVNTGRTSCSSPNFQQLPRIGGIREMFRARDGHTLVITDYSAIELATLSQVSLNMFGESIMGDKINEGHDLHKYYASVMNRCDIDDVTKTHEISYVRSHPVVSCLPGKCF